MVEREFVRLVFLAANADGPMQETRRQHRAIRVHSRRTGRENIGTYSSMILMRR
jgi:hypothetical protein